jgi:hypothetical protein
MLVRYTLIPALLLAATAATAAPTSKKHEPKHDPNAASKTACVAAHEEGQNLRAEKKLRAAREKFVACAKSECPAVLRKECGEQIESIEAVSPSLVFEARDEKGNADGAVKVSLDGTVVSEHLTGSSLEVEPGEHTVKFERADGKVIEQKVLVAEGEKNRKIVAEYASLVPKGKDEPPPPAIADHAVPLGSYIAGGVALVAVGSFAVFALTGKSTEDDLAGKCSPNCSDDEVGKVNRDYLIADVSLGVAAVATIVAVVLALPAFGSSASVKTANVARTPAPWFPKMRVVTP